MRTATALIAIGGIVAAVATSTATAVAPADRQAVPKPQVGEPVPMPSTQQTIRLESVDDRVRIRLEGHETWSIDASGFDVVPYQGGVRFRAQPLDIRVQTPKSDNVANEFELTVSPTGTLGFEIRDMSRRQRP